MDLKLFSNLNDSTTVFPFLGPQYVMLRLPAIKQMLGCCWRGGGVAAPAVLPGITLRSAWEYWCSTCARSNFDGNSIVVIMFRSVRTCLREVREETELLMNL